MNKVDVLHNNGCGISTRYRSAICAFKLKVNYSLIEHTLILQRIRIYLYSTHYYAYKYMRTCINHLLKYVD